MDVFDKGERAPVPLMIGFNSGEIRSLKSRPPAPATAADYGRIIRERYLDLSGEFRGCPAPTCRRACGRRRETLSAVDAAWFAQTEQGVASFLYLFDHGYPADDAGLHAFHAAEAVHVRHLRSHVAALAEDSSDTG